MELHRLPCRTWPGKVRGCDGRPSSGACVCYGARDPGVPAGAVGDDEAGVIVAATIIFIDTWQLRVHVLNCEAQHI